MIHLIFFQARLDAIQTDPGTYCNEPDGPPDHYETWQESFDLDERKGEISDLLVANTDVRALFTKLVSLANRVFLFFDLLVKIMLFIFKVKLSKFTNLCYKLALRVISRRV